MSVAAVVSFEHVSFFYDDSPVVSDATFDVVEGQFVSIVGPNGGGKTTLLKLMLGVLKPRTGRVAVFGEPPARVRRRIGYMPQHARHDPLFPVTVMDVVLMGRVERHWGGRYSRADVKAALSALEEVGLRGETARPFSSLSGGQRQRVLIARALSTEPQILALDEPMANVDIAVGARFYDILKELNRRMTIIMVTHDLGYVSDLVTSVICVNRNVALHATGEITPAMIQEVYGQEMRQVRHDWNLGGGREGHG